MISPPRFDDAQPYLRAATAGIRHHTRAQARTTPATPVDRRHLDALHAHLTALHQLLDALAEAIRPRHPAAGRDLAEARTHVWQASAGIHDAFHLLPTPEQETTRCDPGGLPEGPPVLTICQRHLAAGHAVRRTTTPSDLNRTHSTACVR